MDVQTDPKNCGSIYNSCGFNEVCTKGRCGCRPGTTNCSGVCIDTSVSSINCGSCGARCAIGLVCTYGACDLPVSDWPTFGHDPAHSGENKAETGRPPLTLSWDDRWGLVGTANYPVLSGGQLYVTHEQGYGLYAWNVSDGFSRWIADFDHFPRLRGMPAVFSNTVYVVDTEVWGDKHYLWAFDTDGAVRWRSQLPDFPQNLGAPLRVADTVFTNAGTAGGLYGFSSSDGAQKFLEPMDPSYDSWSAAYFSGRIYTFSAGHFRAHDPTTGAIQNQLDLTWTAGENARAVPVFNSDLAFVITPPDLVAINPALNQVAWSAGDAYSGTPAVSENSVYAISAGQLVVRDATSGSLEWSFTGDAQLSYPPVIANGYVYVASDENLYAVDISTHLAVDHKPLGGWLIVGNHRLIVTPKNKPVTAYVLSK